MNDSRVAVVDATGTYTYGDLDAAAQRVADRLLRESDDLQEARIAFLVAPGFEYVAVQRGIWRAGGIAVPLAVSHPSAELEYVIRDSASSLLVADGSFVDLARPLAEAAGVRFAVASDLIGERSGSSLRVLPRMLPHVGASRRGMIVYTSGTTGRPKGVVSTHANIAAQVASLVEAWQWTPQDRVLLVLPMHHVHGIINGLGCATAVHATCEFMPFEARRVWDRLASGEITVFTAVPTMYHRLIAAWEKAPADVQQKWSHGSSRLRLMMSGSAALPVQVLERWQEITGHVLLERYGMTELGMALSNPLNGMRRAGSVGRVLPGVEVRLVDDAGEPVKAGTAGELEVRGANVFLEYWQRPDETSEAFHDGWFRTGDVAILERGSFRLLGRRSVDIIKTGGYKVSALEIEEVLRTHPAIAECAVVGVSDPEWGERVSAAVELRPRMALSLDELQTWARAQLAPYKVPRALEVVKALPRNAMGKVVKPEVATLFAASEASRAK
jgi:malonyl-CoA/methylmalonyl-CoA synthetase